MAGDGPYVTSLIMYMETAHKISVSSTIKAEAAEEETRNVTQRSGMIDKMI